MDSLRALRVCSRVRATRLVHTWISLRASPTKARATSRCFCRQSYVHRAWAPHPPLSASAPSPVDMPFARVDYRVILTGTCSICLDDFDNTEAAQLSCDQTHAMHVECLSTTIRMLKPDRRSGRTPNPRCPLCRMDISTDGVRVLGGPIAEQQDGLMSTNELALYQAARDEGNRIPPRVMERLLRTEQTIRDRIA
jgi:hypothetical protein